MININDIIEYQFALLLKGANTVEIVIVDIVVEEIDDIDDGTGAFWRMFFFPIGIKLRSTCYLLHT